MERQEFDPVDQMTRYLRWYREGYLSIDTTGAGYGQLAGALYGEDGIPESWRARLAHLDLAKTLAERLLSKG